jgi:hypothetical protein
MIRKFPTFSAGKVGQQQYYWVVLPPDPELAHPDNALAEGVAPTGEEAWSAARSAAFNLGIRAKKGYASSATWFHYTHRGGRVAAPPPGTTPIRKGPPKSDAFLGSPYLWTHVSYWDDMTNDYCTYWVKHLVVRVTNKYVFVMERGAMEGKPDPLRDSLETYRRLDRAALERDGRARSRNSGMPSDIYYTEAGREVRVAELAEIERRQAAACCTDAKIVT